MMIGVAAGLEITDANEERAPTATTELAEASGAEVFVTDDDEGSTAVEISTDSVGAEEREGDEIDDVELSEDDDADSITRFSRLAICDFIPIIMKRIWLRETLPSVV